MKNQNGFTLVETIILGMYLLGAIACIGWVINIIRLVGMDWCMCKWTILRIVGVFAAPLGAILGFIPR